MHQKRPVWQQIPDSTTCLHILKETYKTDPRTNQPHQRYLCTSKQTYLATNTRQYVRTHIQRDLQNRPKNKKNLHQRNLYTSKETCLATNTRQYNVPTRIQRDLQNRSTNTKKNLQKRPIHIETNLINHKRLFLQHTWGGFGQYYRLTV